MLQRCIAEKDAALAAQHALLAEKDAALAAKDAILAEKDAALAENQTKLAEKDTVLAEKVHHERGRSTTGVLAPAYQSCMQSVMQLSVQALPAPFDFLELSQAQCQMHCLLSLFLQHSCH